MLYRLAATIVVSAVLTACIPPSDEPADVPIDLNLGDPELQRVFELQNDRAEDSLRYYLGHEDARLRFLAARALGSFPTLGPATIDSLATLLDDEASVRTEAAYALGQTESPRAAELLTEAFDRSGRYPAFNAAVLAAVGKSADAEAAERLAGITTYTTEDTLLMEGRLWGLYYAALRDHHPPAADRTVLEIVNDPAAAAELRHPAAHYLHRIAVEMDTADERRLRQSLRTEADPVVAMGLIRALGRSGHGAARVALLRHYEKTRDWRQRVEILRAFAGYEYSAVRESVIEALRDPHPLVALTAARYLINHGIEADAPLYLQLAEDPLPHPVGVQLYQAANRHLSLFLTDYRDRINNELRRAYRATDDAYRKADILLALAEFPWMYRVIFDYYEDATSTVVRTAAAEALAAISDRDDFAEFFRGSNRRVRRELADYFRAMIEEGGDGPVYHAARAITAQAEVYRGVYRDRDWLDESLDALSLPRQIEAYREVEQARAALAEEPAAEVAVASGEVRDIDWAAITGEEIVATLTTEAGSIRLRLWPEAAPATVSSFLELAGRGYYDGKTFHRVVPNFVAQGGGPRGDGFGGEDFSLRTETPMMHWDRAGLLGMASAGKDTEGVQFFITHRPTPHLDGKYTIFGEVIEGQEVVDNLLPGARIVSIALP